MAIFLQRNTVADYTTLRLLKKYSRPCITMLILAAYATAIGCQAIAISYMQNVNERF